MYKFCPLCGKKISKQRHNLFVCSFCGFHFYQNPAPTTGVFLTDKENKILLVERKFDPQKGFWDVPGGFVEPDETAENALKRELKEELGISGRNFSYLSSYTSDYHYQQITYKTICLMFTAEIGGQKITIGDDVADFEWFSYKEIPAERLAFGFIRKALDDWKSYR